MTRLKIGFGGTLSILLPYVRDNLLEQIKSVWFIVFYLVFFQIVILGLPIVHSSMIGVGLLVVAIGLMFFMEGLRIGLMPLGETIGAVLPRNSSLPVILGFAFLLGVGATFAEPAIAVLKAAGSGVAPDSAPLLYSLLNDFSGQLVMSVGVGVGFAVMLGVLRFFYGWSLKYLIIPGVVILSVLTIIGHNNPVVNPVLGLAWDCGAVTTGPVTVPLVLALGIGVCRIVGDGDVRNAGFGIVTMASLFPILAVLCLAFYHYHADDYYGQPNYQGELAADMSTTDTQVSSNQDRAKKAVTRVVSEEEFDAFVENPVYSEDYVLRFEGGEPQLSDGRIRLSDSVLVLEKVAAERPTLVSDQMWDPRMDMVAMVQTAAIDALRAIIPLCLFLLITLKLVLTDPLRNLDEVLIGIGFSVIGMGLFLCGILIGLTPLGTQLGSNVPATFTSIVPWGMTGVEGPLYLSQDTGKLIAILFGFFLGYGATLAEPALNALGDTVEKITIGAFRKRWLMQCVAIGVGLGIGAGVCKIAFDIPLAYLLIPPYLLLIVLTLISDESFVNFGWDSAGVTTGPITVPLVLALGLGIVANVPDVIDGFGILALASVGPILTVLTVGLLLNREQVADYDELEVS